MFVTRLSGESFYRRFESMDDVYAARKSSRKTEVLWVTPLPFDDGYLVVVENNSSSTGEQVRIALLEYQEGGFK